MKICFPILEDRGLASSVNAHFGSTQTFLVYDTDADAFETFANRDAGHAHGACQPLRALDGRRIDAVVLGGIGRGALLKLTALGIRVYRATAPTVENNLRLYREGALDEIAADAACAGHAGCEHRG